MFKAKHTWTVSNRTHCYVALDVTNNRPFWYFAVAVVSKTKGTSPIFVRSGNGSSVTSLDFSTLYECSLCCNHKAPKGNETNGEVSRPIVARPIDF